jgi:hypothetical protein
MTLVRQLRNVPPLLVGTLLVSWALAAACDRNPPADPVAGPAASTGQPAPSQGKAPRQPPVLAGGIRHGPPRDQVNVCYTSTYQGSAAPNAYRIDTVSLGSSDEKNVGTAGFLFVRWRMPAKKIGQMVSCMLPNSEESHRKALAFFRRTPNGSVDGADAMDDLEILTDQPEGVDPGVRELPVVGESAHSNEGESLDADDVLGGESVALVDVFLNSFADESRGDALANTTPATPAHKPVSRPPTAPRTLGQTWHQCDLWGGNLECDGQGCVYLYSMEQWDCGDCSASWTFDDWSLEFTVWFECADGDEWVGSGGSGPPPPSYTAQVTVTPASVVPNAATTAKVTLSPAVPGQSVQLSSLPFAHSGGHMHDMNRPVGTFAAISGVTNSSGVFSTVYRASQFGGQEQISASIGGSGATVSANLNVLIPDLFPLAAGPNYDNTWGSTPTHPASHYGTYELNFGLQIIADDYAAAYPGSILRYNDMSLERGGWFDVGAAWTGAHAEHRFGLNCDVSPTNVPPSRYATLEQIFLDNVMTFLGLDHAPSAPHWHLRSPF